MKVTANKSREGDTVVEYSNWPEDGVSIGKIVEWENGEGVDIFLDSTHVELTWCELDAIIALAGIKRAKP